MINEENNLREVEGRFVFREGDTFDTYEELLERLNVHSKESLVYYWRRDSRTVERAFTKTSRQIASKLKYYVVRFACIYGGMKIRNDHGTTNYNNTLSSRSPGKRANPSIQPTTRTNCPSYIQLRASKCGQKLEVISVCNLHNHEISERISQTLPHNRKLTGAVREEVNELLRLKIDRKKIMEYVKQREDKTITSKDLFNMATRLMKQKHSSSDSLAEIKRRITILRKINSFIDDKSVRSIINREIIACESELSILYSIDTNNLIEYISPEHEFGVNATIIDSIVEGRKHDINKSICIDDTSRRENEIIDIIDTIKVNDVDSTSNLLNFNDLIVEDDEDCGLGDENLIDEDEINIDESDQVDNDNFDAANIVYDPPAPSTAIYNELMSQNVREELEFVREEGFDDYAIMASNEIQSSMENYDFACLSQVSDDAEKTNGNFCVKRKEEKEETKNHMNRRKKLKGIKDEVQNSRKRVIRCRKCGTNAKLLQMQINYLKRKASKLYEETNVLNLTKLKLKLEIQQLKKDLL